MWNKVEEIPFNSSNKFMGVGCQDHSGQLTYFFKGAPDVLLPMCRSYFQDLSTQPPMNDHVQQQVTNTSERFGNDGLRVLGLAFGPVRGTPEQNEKERAERPEGGQTKLTLFSSFFLYFSPKSTCVLLV